MSKLFEVIDSQETPMGTITLQRRKMLMLDGLDVFEVKLGEEWLMSSLFHDAEIALADLSLATLEGSELDVAVGGLGLGYTAAAALKNPKVKDLFVIETLNEVIGWHREGLVPLGRELSDDPRCHFIQADFFEWIARPGRKFDAILLDIDHSPEHYLHSRHAAFYEPPGLTVLARQLKPGGVFALWSDAAPDPDFTKKLEQVFTDCRAEIVTFHNPLQMKDSANTVYLARHYTDLV
jgi:spermidine synthase